MDIRPMTPTERMYSYSQSMQIQGQTGSIGYLRGDFGPGGNEFYTTWNDHRAQWKTDEFKAEFDTVINSLRSEEYGLLQNRSAMSAFAQKHPESTFQGNFSPEHGFRVDTDNYTYLCRCIPSQGDYNFYVYPYVGKWLNEHMQKAEKGIRFIDSHYKELFRIPDGDKIVITSASGEKNERTCRFIDEYHTEVDSYLYHICEFAERMEQNGSTYAPAAEQEVIAGYRITDKLPVGDKIFVLGENPHAVQPFVTWQGRQDRKGYDLGHYFSDKKDAQKDLQRRVSEEQSPTDPGKGPKQKNAAR